MKPSCKQRWSEWAMSLILIRVRVHQLTQERRELTNSCGTSLLSLEWRKRLTNFKLNGSNLKPQVSLMSILCLRFPKSTSRIKNWVINLLCCKMSWMMQGSLQKKRAVPMINCVNRKIFKRLIIDASNKRRPSSTRVRAASSMLSRSCRLSLTHFRISTISRWKRKCSWSWRRTVWMRK